MRIGDEMVAFEGKVEVTTAKARLIETVFGAQVWLPKSQTISVGEKDVDGNQEFTVTEWWAKKNGLA
jgi:hypothetical protein